MTRRHGLSDEDEALWTSVTRSIKPLRSKPPQSQPSAKPIAKSVAKSPRAASKIGPPSHAAAVQEKPPAKPAPLAPFDRRFKQRVARGRAAIDARIDLHGMTQSEAPGALLHFLRRTQAAGGRIVLVVTGKGSPRARGGAGAERGVLKRQVPLWLALPEFRPLIVGFDDAHAGHGGEGALYVRLRRIRD